MPRRGRGEGSIRQRTDGRWEATISLPIGAGSRRKSFYGKTRREVADKLAAGLRDLHRGLQPMSDRRTVASYLDEWLAAAEHNTRPATFDRYRAIVRLHVVPHLGRHPLSRLAPADVERMLNAIVRTAGTDPEARRKRHRTASHVRAVLRTALNRAVRHGLVASNAAANATWRQPPAKEVQYLTPEEAQTLMESLGEDRYEALITLAIVTGARQGELLGLRWQDVDLDARTIRIRHSLQRGQLMETKTDKSRRTVGVGALGVAALGRQRARQKEQRLWAGRSWQGPDRPDDPAGYVFTSTIGTPLDSTNVTHRLQALLARAGLPRMRFHDLRHTHATVLLARGVHPRVVMERLGHSQISLTMNTYSHVMPVLDRDAAEQMDRALGG